MKFRGKMAATAVAAVGWSTVFAFGVAPAAEAGVVRGQYVSTSGRQCWGQEYITGGYNAGPVHFQEKSYIYRNCGTATRYRKADVIADRDGPCYGISKGKARVLEVKYVFPRQVYRTAKSC